MSMQHEPATETPAETGGRLSGAAVARLLPLILVLGAIGYGLGALASSQRPVEYAATTTVLVNPLDGNPYSTGAVGQNLANLSTEIELISSDPVVRLAWPAVRTPADASALVEHLTVNNPPNSQVLEITFSDPDPARAKAGADAFANGYLTFRERRSAQSVQAQIDALQKSIAVNELTLRRSTEALNKAKAGTPARALAQQKVSATAAEISRLESRVSDLRLFKGDGGQVLSPAEVPTEPTGLPGWVTRVGGAVAGLLIGLLLALWRVASDRRLRSADDVRRGGLPALATVNPVARGEVATLLRDPDAKLPDGARLLRSILTVSMPIAGRLLVVPADEITARSATPLALAVALVRADRAVTLVDATGGPLSLQIGDTQTAGLSDALLAGMPAQEATVEPQPGLSFMTAGTAAEAASDKLSSPRMKDLIGRLGSTTPWLIIAGPVATSPETLSMAELCDGVVITATRRRTTHADLQRAVEAVTAGGANLVGIALDQAPAPHRRTRAGHREAPDAFDPDGTLRAGQPRPASTTDADKEGTDVDAGDAAPANTRSASGAR